MRKIDQLTNQYSISKTLQFSLKPIGKTDSYFIQNHILETDQILAENYKIVKEEIKRYHRYFIDRCMSDFSLQGLNEFTVAYYSSDEKLEELRDGLKKQIVQRFKGDEDYKKVLGKEMITEFLPEFVDVDKREAVNSFAKFTTYFTGFNDNIENIYTNNNHATEVTYRLISDNLPKFLDNAKILDKYREQLKPYFETLLGEFPQGVDLPFKKYDDLCNPESFNSTLTQTGIDLYNQVIGGYSTDDQNFKGLNQYINEHPQQDAIKIPKLKQLFKQILSEKTTLSFIPSAFETDEAVLVAIRQYKTELQKLTEKIQNLFEDLSAYQLDGIFVDAKELSTLSNRVLGRWDKFQISLEEEYDASHTEAERKSKKYEENKKAYFKKKEYYALSDLMRFDSESKLLSTICKSVEDSLQKVNETVVPFEQLKDDAKLLGNEANTEIIKNYLDSILALKTSVGIFNESNGQKDNYFYGSYEELMDVLGEIIPLYNKTRNYLTKKSYSKDKIKLNFENSQLFNGWDLNKEKDYRTVLFRQDGKYFVGIINEEYKTIFDSVPTVVGEEKVYEKMIYKLLPGPNKMLPKVVFAKSNEKLFNPPSEIKRKYDKGTHKSGKDFSLKDCHKLIDFFKECIKKYPSWNSFGFHFSDTSTYANISEFYKEVAEQGYKVTFNSVPESYINECIESGKLYLFQIYNKDFSEYSHGKKNLHTLYFEQLFTEKNLSNPVFILNGGAELFYRPADPRLNRNEITHPKNHPINNKNPLNKKKQSVFEYDLVKDSRYRRSDFKFHVPIKMNAFSGDGYPSKIKTQVRSLLRKCPNNYVIGIDRGERNLLYVSVIDGNGKIVEQFSANIVRNEKYQIETDYHALLDQREKQRDESRKSWKSLDSIADLKKGYLSQIVHRICLLVEKYDAIVALEDLNGGFKNSRKKVEKSIYQEFEKALIEKLNFLVFKDKQADEFGGLRKAYQLADAFTSFKDMSFQNGILFYIPAWNTSKIDPTTGFVDLLKPRCEKSDTQSKEFFARFKSIRYNPIEKYFEFSFSYADFPKADIDYRKEWIVCSYGDRIRSFRNAEKNNEWDSEVVVPTECFKALFDKASIQYADGRELKNEILKQNGKEFFNSLTEALKLTLQMRNSRSGTDEDYLLSPVKNKAGTFFDSRNYHGTDAPLPLDADANGAYHIAKKALWAIEKIKAASEEKYQKESISISNKEWLEFVQKN